MKATKLLANSTFCFPSAIPQKSKSPKWLFGVGETQQSHHRSVTAEQRCNKTHICQIFGQLPPSPY